MEGIDYDYDKIDEDGTIEVEGKKKREWWYNIYKFSSSERYQEWLSWVRRKVEENNYTDIDKETSYIDFRYGMTYKYI